MRFQQHRGKISKPEETNQQHGWTRSMEEDPTRKLEILKEKNNQIKILGIRSTSNNNNNKKHGERHQQT